MGINAILNLFVPFFEHVEKAGPLSVEAIDVQYNNQHYDVEHMEGRT